jgi:uncharacterized protein
MRYYLNVAPIIYLVEQIQPFATAVRSKLRSRLSLPGSVVVTSEMARLECRVKSLRGGDALLLQDFDDYFARTVANIIPLTRDVIDRVTEIRAQHNFKTPDALHLAAAVVTNCDIFLTNDHRLNRFTEIAIEVV